MSFESLEQPLSSAAEKKIATYHLLTNLSGLFGHEPNKAIGELLKEINEGLQGINNLTVGEALLEIQKDPDVQKHLTKS